MSDYNKSINAAFEVYRKHFGKEAEDKIKTCIASLNSDEDSDFLYKECGKIASRSKDLMLLVNFNKLEDREAFRQLQDEFEDLTEESLRNALVFGNQLVAKG